MEYDDSDFGSQNQLLNSEEITKLSPVVSTYSLPKFDFDESLQGDIRFGSLVETGTFRGIESQEDTSWIKDFSRGSSRIDLSSRASESASILRRNNLWSEMASLESVAQKKIICGETESQNSSAIELGSSCMQLAQNKEDKEYLNVKDVISCAALPLNELLDKFPNEDAPKLHHTEDVKSVTDQLCVSAHNNIDMKRQETDAETVQCPLGKDTQVIGIANSPSVEEEHDQVEAATLSERALQAPVLKTESQANCQQTLISLTENFSSGLHQVSDTCNELNKTTLQVNTVEDLSESIIEPKVEGIDHTAMVNDMQADDSEPEGETAEGVNGDLQSIVPLESDMNSGGQSGPIGTGNDHLKEQFGCSTKGHHNYHSMELCRGQVDASSHAENCKYGSDNHVDAEACKGSNVALEGGLVFVGDSAEATSLNSGNCHDRKKLSDGPVTGCSGVHKINELCVSPKQNEMPEEFLARGSEICGTDVEEDGLGGCTEKMERAAALKKPTENDKILRIASGEMNGQVANDDFSSSVVCSSTVLETATRASEDSSVCITPTVYEEHITKGVNISSFTTIDLETLETTAGVDLSDVNDKCKDAIMNMQSNSELSNAGDENCSTGGLLNEEIVVDPPFCSVSNTQNEGTPSMSPSAIPAASGRDSEEHKVIHSSVSCCTCSEIRKDDTETEDSIQGQLDRSLIACINTGSFFYDGSNPQDPKASDASDNDKTFSFIVASSAEHSERESNKLWQPFASQLPTDSQNVEDSLSTPGMEKISLINLGSRQTTAEDNLPSCKSTPARKPGRAPGKTNKESVKRESRQKLAAPSKLQESSIFPIVVSGLPDLNHASSPPTLRPQHFTDLQQLQLRAQIFVYGSLIQGTAPDEACMVAAFGGPGGGRSIWETARRQCLERIQGARAADPEDKTSKYKNKSNNTLTPRKFSKSALIHATISHLIPPASPLWTLDTPNRVHCSGMPIGTVLGHNGNPQFNSHLSSPMTSTASSWSPQPVPWVSWPQSSALKASPPPMMDAKMGPVKLTPVRQSSMSKSSGRHSNPSPVAHSSVNTSIILEAQSPLTENTTLNSNPGQTPFDLKSRKKKKTEVIKALMPMVAEPLHQVELVSAAYGRGIFPTSAIADLSSESKVKTNASSFTIPSASAPSTDRDHATKGNTNVGNRTVVFEDLCSKMNEAKLYAEDAASHAVAAVDCSQEMWRELAKQKDSGLLPDIEAKVASAALAIAAAVAVAKAAVAAAKVASNAALHAKLTAEEAMDSSRISFIDSPTEVSFNRSANNLGNAMLSSALKGGNQMNSSGILGGMLNAEEKIKSVSAASKQAENINAILKAAELAAEAVTQAGKVGVMGDKIPLTDIVIAGPEGCWKLPKLTSERELQSNSVIECHVVEANTEVANTSKRILETNHMPKQTTDNHSMDLISDDGYKPTYIDLSNKVKKAVGTAEAIPIKEGSFVEVYKEGDAIKAAWFPACVLELKNGEAHVCYTENPPTGSSGEIKEWIRLDIHENKAPKIRAAHPMTAMPADGTRKRHREAMGTCYWSVGDKVDAWRQNCWWEGIITEKCSKDDTAFTVHFSAQGEPAIIKACHLRPSLIRQNGEWVQCSNSSYDGCIRQEKRMKLYDPKHEVELNEKAPDNVGTTQPRMHGESRLLMLSDNKKTFDVGKSSKNDKRPVTRRTAQAGLQNEGEKVIFGVPKPGKKTKLMDASQQHVSVDITMNKRDDSMRHPKTLLSQGSGLPVWKTSSRIDMREKKVPATQLRVPDSRKPTGVSHRTLEKNSVSSAVSCNVNAFGSQGMTGFASFSSIGRVQNSPFGFSMSSNEDPSKKTFTSTSSKPELASKSKFEPPLKKLGNIEEDKVHNGSASTSVSDGGRRSNRRIQPTSRLLEGLQTSLGIQKLPSASHGKGLKKPQQ